MISVVLSLALTKVRINSPIWLQNIHMHVMDCLRIKDFLKIKSKQLDIELQIHYR